MNICHGISVLEKIAVGKIVFYKKCRQTPCREKKEDAEKEIARFDAAREAALNELDDLIRETAGLAGGEEAAVFEGHMMLVQDCMFRNFVCDAIREQQVSAESAVGMAEEHFTRMLLRTDDEYMRERTADIADISERLIRLLGEAEGMSRIEGLPECNAVEPLILAADELTPGDIMRLDFGRIRALVVRSGTANSHMAILARAMNVPVILGVGVREDWTGRMAVVDGISGDVILDPDDGFMERMRAGEREMEEREAALKELRGMETVTRGGRRIGLYANIAEGSDVDAAMENGAEGIGLFRSEFLYLQSADWPTEEEQFAAYRAAVESMKGKPVVIRTLDAGADKQLPYLKISDAHDADPGSDGGERGIKVCLDRPEMFRTQLRAILRAAAYGRVAVMFPMIRSEDEVMMCREQLALAREELEAENKEIPFRDVETGIMIETPEAVEHSAGLAREADFFSIGTNDLIPALLGTDRFGGPSVRQDAGGAEVKRALEKTICAAHDAGIRVGICGEMAADTEMTGMLVDMGIDELSVAPPALMRVKERVRGLE